MEDGVGILGRVTLFCMDILAIEFTIWGFTLSLWDVFTFVVVNDIVFWAIWEVILGDE